jgi:CSLREA domain-containing protein
MAAVTPTSRAVVLGAALGILGALPAGALGATITVTTKADAVAADGQCGLREAISATEWGAGAAGAAWAGSTVGA